MTAVAGSARRVRRRVSPALISMFVVAVAVRLVLATQVDNYYWYGGMVGGLHLDAANLAAGRGFVIGDRQGVWLSNVEDTEARIAAVGEVPAFDADRYAPETSRLPLYPTLQAVSFRLFGNDQPLKFAQIFGDATVALLLVALASRAFTRAVAYGSGFLYALWPPMARNAIHGLPEAWLPLLLAVSLLLFFRALDTRRIGWFLAAGAVVGGTAYLRSEWLLFALFVMLLVLLARRDRRTLLGLAAMVFAAGVMVSPWLARNWQLGAGPSMSTSTGIVLWEGLGEFANPWGAVPDDTLVAQQMRSLGIADAATANAYYTARFVQSIKHDPAVYASEVARRLPRVLFAKTDWGLAELNSHYPGFQELNAVESVSVVEFARRNPLVFLAKAIPLAGDIALFVLAAVGLLLASGRGLRTWLLAAPPLFAIGLYGSTHFESRYLVPAMFPYCVFAASAIAAMWKGAQARILGTTAARSRVAVAP